MTAISQYFARVAIDVDQSSLKKVDEYFKSLDTKMQRYKGRLGNGLKIKVTVDIDTRSTMLNLRRKLDTIGQGLTLTVKRMQFAINGKQIRSQAERQLSAGLRVRVLPFIRRTNILDIRRQIISGVQNIPISVRYQGNFRQTLMNRINASLAPARPSGRASGGSTGPSGRGGGGAGYGFPGNLMVGPTGRLLRFGTAAVPFVGGAMGLSTLNQANTDYQSQKIAAAGVFEKYGGGDAARKQLFDVAQLRGIDYKTTLPQFTQFMASAMPAMGYGKSFGAFQSFLEFGRARGATAESMHNALYAVSQMAGKGKVSQEELSQQLGDAAGFGEMKAIFAQAWAEHTKSGLTGQKAINALMDATKKGIVNTPDVLPRVSAIASERVSGVIGLASQSADAQQNRYKNARQKFMESFSENGGEAGLARMWDSLGRMMETVAARGPALANTFDKISIEFTKFVNVISDLGESMRGGYGTSGSILVQNATGINFAAIGEFFKPLEGKLDSVVEKLGYVGTIPAAIAAYQGVKLVKGMAGGAFDKWLGKATGGNLGDGGNFAQYRHPSGGLKVWVLNSSYQLDRSAPDVDRNGKPKPGSPQQKSRWGKWGLLSGVAEMFTGTTAGVVAGLGVSAGALGYMHPDQKSPSVWADSSMMGAGMNGLLMDYNADRFTTKNISQAAPVVDNAKTATIQNNTDVRLTADIKIEASTAEDALEKFRIGLDEQVLQPFMQRSLLEAQATFSTFGR